jgi:tRNA A37 methylthiotransferase MiaB
MQPAHRAGHLPDGSGDDRETRRALVRQIRRGIPGVAFRTNFIVGFPGETEQHFETLCRFVEQEPFENLVVFGYEREPETPSHAMVPRVPIQKRRSRRSQLLALQQRLSRERLRSRIGERMTVMIDGPAGPSDRPGPRSYAARAAGSAFEVDGEWWWKAKDSSRGCWSRCESPARRPMICLHAWKPRTRCCPS